MAGDADCICERSHEPQSAEERIHDAGQEHEEHNAESLRVGWVLSDNVSRARCHQSKRYVGQPDVSDAMKERTGAPILESAIQPKGEERRARPQ